MNFNQVIHGNCIEVLKTFESEKIDLIYFDPPFFTQKKHSLSTRDNTKIYEFEDKFDSLQIYLQLIENVLIESKRILKATGSLFLHCDKTAAHHIRTILDKVLGEVNFQSEIIWHYKRWSNAKKGLLNTHQVIFFYSKTKAFKFNTIYTDYAATTNLDQILQERKKDKFGKSVYKRDEEGNIVIGKEKKGVPLSDVWEIPYLNPKAKERMGYPTQKPVLLLNRILEIASDEGDLVLDPFCGSGTTCVAAKLLKRNYIGIDISQDAVNLTNQRLDEMIISHSDVLIRGQEEYLEKTEREMQLLNSVGAIPVQRNAGIDGFLKEYLNGFPVPVKIQGKYESLEDAIEKLEKASMHKQYPLKIVIQTQINTSNRLFSFESSVKVIKSVELQAQEMLKNITTIHI